MKERGFGAVYRPTYKDRKTGGLKASSIWWIRFYVHGKRRLENSHSRNRSEAQRLLKKRLGELVDGKLQATAIQKTHFTELGEMLRNDYQVNGRRSLKRAERIDFSPQRILRSGQSDHDHLRSDLGLCCPP